VKASVAVVHELVRGISPVDGLEARQRADVLRWLESTDDVFRRSKPAVPSQHLVSYVVLLDQRNSDVLLVDHIKADLWLPPGGHVDPDEHPAVTARRECREELGFDPTFVDESERPSFVTVTTTIGLDAGHIDVSLWFVCAGRVDMSMTTDATEFRAARWWSPDEVAAADAHRFDPHFQRFMAKVTPTA
jgi:8-oxo-dGTP diphosphatase